MGWEALFPLKLGCFRDWKHCAFFFFCLFSFSLVLFVPKKNVILSLNLFIFLFYFIFYFFIISMQWSEQQFIHRKSSHCDWQFDGNDILVSEKQNKQTNKTTKVNKVNKAQPQMSLLIPRILGNNSLSGSIPTQIGNLASLSTLLVAFYMNF